MDSYITRLREIELIAGDSQVELEFQVFYKDGEPIDLQDDEVKWYLAPIGQKHLPKLIKSKGNGCEIIKDVDSQTGETLAYRFKVTLSSEDTKDLYGKYVHQPVLIDKHKEPDQTFRRAEGFINFRPHIGNI